ncbi:MAG: type II toxin-antitoxin system RelE/ParE family toxin [Planctomycetota bacterium]
MEGLKPVNWVASSLDDLRHLPDDVQDAFGYALQLAQQGDKHAAAKPLKGFGGAGVLEIVESYDGNAYRAVYTVKFAKAIYVLHVFQKKSKKGIATPPAEIERIRKRFKVAEEHYAERHEKKS